MKRAILLSAVYAIIASAAVIPAQASDCPGFLPPNNLSIPVDSPQAKGIDEAQFNKVLNTIEGLYAPEVASLGKVLQINRLWTNDTVNASAQQSGNKYILNMYGGLARHAAVTMDGFALVVCHELGHHLGGAPRKASTWYPSWASNEGQSDYYANLKCLRRVFADPGANVFTRVADDDGVAVKACEAAFTSPNDQDICVRGTKAGKSVASLFMALHNETTAPRFDTPDPKVVTAMFDSHPATQCRLDTYLQGSVCTRPVESALSDTDAAAGTCTRSAGFATGFRPLCWYKPANDAELLPPGTPFFKVNEEVSPAYAALLRGYTW